MHRLWIKTVKIVFAESEDIVEKNACAHRIVLLSMVVFVRILSAQLIVVFAFKIRENVYLVCVLIVLIVKRIKKLTNVKIMQLERVIIVC